MIKLDELSNQKIQGQHTLLIPIYNQGLKNDQDREDHGLRVIDVVKPSQVFQPFRTQRILESNSLRAGLSSQSSSRKQDASKQRLIDSRQNQESQNQAKISASFNLILQNFENFLRKPNQETTLINPMVKSRSMFSLNKRVQSQLQDDQSQFNTEINCQNLSNQYSNYVKLLKVPVKLSFCLVAFNDRQTLQQRLKDQQQGFDHIDENEYTVAMTTDSKQMTVDHLRIYKIVEPVYKIAIDFAIEIIPQFLDFNQTQQIQGESNSKKMKIHLQNQHHETKGLGFHMSLTDMKSSLNNLNNHSHKLNFRGFTSPQFESLNSTSKNENFKNSSTLMKFQNLLLQQGFKQNKQLTFIRKRQSFKPQIASLSEEYHSRLLSENREKFRRFENLKLNTLSSQFISKQEFNSANSRVSINKLASRQDLVQASTDFQQIEPLHSNSKEYNQVASSDSQNLSLAPFNQPKEGQVLGRTSQFKMNINTRTRASLYPEAQLLNGESLSSMQGKTQPSSTAPNKSKTSVQNSLSLMQSQPKQSPEGALKNQESQLIDKDQGSQKMGEIKSMGLISLIDQEARLNQVRFQNHLKISSQLEHGIIEKQFRLQNQIIRQHCEEKSMDKSPESKSVTANAIGMNSSILGSSTQLIKGGGGALFDPIGKYNNFSETNYFPQSHGQPQPYKRHNNTLDSNNLREESLTQLNKNQIADHESRMMQKSQQILDNLQQTLKHTNYKSKPKQDKTISPLNGNKIGQLKTNKDHHHHQTKLMMQLDMKLFEQVQEHRDIVDLNFFNLKADHMRRTIVKYVCQNQNKKAKGFIQFNNRFHRQNTLDCASDFHPHNRLYQKMVNICEQKGKSPPKLKKVGYNRQKTGKSSIIQIEKGVFQKRESVIQEKRISKMRNSQGEFTLKINKIDERDIRNEQITKNVTSFEQNGEEIQIPEDEDDSYSLDEQDEEIDQYPPEEEEESQESIDYQQEYKNYHQELMDKIENFASISFPGNQKVEKTKMQNLLEIEAQQASILRLNSRLNSARKSVAHQKQQPSSKESLLLTPTLHISGKDPSYQQLQQKQIINLVSITGSDIGNEDKGENKHGILQNKHVSLNIPSEFNIDLRGTNLQSRQASYLTGNNSNEQIKLTIQVNNRDFDVQPFMNAQTDSDDINKQIHGQPVYNSLLSPLIQRQGTNALTPINKALGTEAKGIHRATTSSSNVLLRSGTVSQASRMGSPKSGQPKTSMAEKLANNEDFEEKYQRHVQFNYFCQVPRYKTLLDAQILLRDVQKDIIQWKTRKNVRRAIQQQLGPNGMVGASDKTKVQSSIDNFGQGLVNPPMGGLGTTSQSRNDNGLRTMGSRDSTQSMDYYQQNKMCKRGLKQKRQLKIQPLSEEDEKLFIRQLNLKESVIKEHKC